MINHKIQIEKSNMLKTAILGAGYASKYYLELFTRLDYDLIGICSRTSEKGMKVASNYKVKYFNKYEEMLKSSDIDILIITTPSSNHLEAVEIAAKNNIRNIFCEKPVGASKSDCKEIKNICNKYNIKLGVGYKMRFEGIFRHAKQVFDEGHIGKIISTTFCFFQTKPTSNWYLNEGVIRETLSHVIDLSNWFSNNKVESVLCSSKSFLGGSGEDRASLIINYSSGIVANIIGGWISNYPFVPGRRNISFQIVGKNGYISGIRPDTLVLCNEKGQQIIKIKDVDQIEEEFQDFIESLKVGDPSVNINDALNVHSIISMIKKNIKYF
jgi:predicted dehydrogenase